MDGWMDGPLVCQMTLRITCATEEIYIIFDFSYHLPFWSYKLRWQTHTAGQGPVNIMTTTVDLLTLHVFSIDVSRRATLSLR